jgi:hypothetical protein
LTIGKFRHLFLLRQRQHPLPPARPRQWHMVGHIDATAAVHSTPEEPAHGAIRLLHVNYHHEPAPRPAARHCCSWCGAGYGNGSVICRAVALPLSTTTVLILPTLTSAKRFCRARRWSDAPESPPSPTALPGCARALNRCRAAVLSFRDGSGRRTSRHQPASKSSGPWRRPKDRRRSSRPSRLPLPRDVGIPYPSSRRFSRLPNSNALTLQTRGERRRSMTYGHFLAVDP